MKFTDAEVKGALKEAKGQLAYLRNEYRKDRRLGRKGSAAISRQLYREALVTVAALHFLQSARSKPTPS